MMLIPPAAFALAHQPLLARIVVVEIRLAHPLAFNRLDLADPDVAVPHRMAVVLQADRQLGRAASYFGTLVPRRVAQHLRSG